jgi:hypothetical protein
VQRALSGIAGIRELSLANAARFEGSVMIDSYLSLYDKVRNGRSEGRIPISQSDKSAQLQEQL